MQYPISGSIWRRVATPEAINAFSEGTLHGLLGLRVTEVGPDHLRAEMPVDQRHRQPFDLLHGGASVVISETLGSIASSLAAGPGFRCVGLEVNANHVAAVTVGQTVTAVCRALHVGRSTQVWQTEVFREDGRLACVSRLTTAVMPA
jgi:1,4-dihydroxy-2-naphthoyl-CoA hydrolase